MTDSYYELIDAADPLGEKFAATEMVISTWSPAIQHGAPVSALLVRSLERCAQRDDTRLSRVVVDLLGAVPVTDELWVYTEVDRAGKQIERVSATMAARGADGEPRVVAHASGWRLQMTDTNDLVYAPQPPLPPVAQGRRQDAEGRWARNYLHSVDWRWLTEVLADGPGESWFKPIVDLVKGESMTPTQRLFTVADNANGLGSRLDIGNWTFLNTDLAVHVHRTPGDGWIGIRSETSYGPDGVATAVGTLFDEQGAVGSIQQSVLVRRRPSK